MNRPRSRTELFLGHDDLSSPPDDARCLAAAVLRPTLKPLTCAAGPVCIDHVLLTGSTGFFGAYVLADWLSSSSAHVVCLVRGRSDQEARARLAYALERSGRRVSAEVLASRVTVVAGDFGALELGIERGPGASTYEALAERVDTVVHIGPRFDDERDVGEGDRSANVRAIETLLRFSATRRVKSFHYVSTLDVLDDTDPSDPRARLERFPASSPSRLRDATSRSHWVAERLVFAARDRGFPTFVHRRGHLSGDSATGAPAPHDVFLHLLACASRVKALPRLDVDIAVTPVDYASRALVQIVRASPESPAAFHLVGPRGVPFATLASALGAHGLPLETVDYDTWRARIASVLPDEGEALASLSKEELERRIGRPAACEATRATLGSRVPPAPLDDALAKSYVHALRTAGAVRESLPPRSSTQVPLFV